MGKSNYIIEMSNISKSFHDKVVLDDVSLSVKKGEFLTILGPSGCGKTTLLRLLAGFNSVKTGEIRIDGKDVTTEPPHLRPVNTVFQRYALFPNYNVYDNIAFGLKLKKVDKKEIEQRVKRALKMVGMTDYEHRDVQSLSGGQQQRVAIARAIVNRPQVLLLDEPLAALDLKMRKDMQMELKEMHRSLGITFVYVTHDQEEALTLSDTIVVMNEGVIQQIGTPTDIYNEPCNAFVADFIGESNILNATMVRDHLVSFMGKEFECIDEGFGENTPVDVVVRPEDVYIIRNAEAAMFHGTVRSCIFKGVHYEMFVDTPEGYEIQIQDYNCFEPGTEVGMMIKPADIHVMRKACTENHIRGVLVDATHVEMLGELFETLPVENITPGTEVDVAFDFEAVELTDDPDDGTSWGTIRFILYKGDRYHLTVRTDDNEDIFIDTRDVWEDLDEVGIKIAPSALRITTFDAE
ncbi:MAG: polyamine ABC transporter ATP-binding protein [Alistipes sp.]|jgi:spermidine/putrescine transport system ATP-binding protein|nr:polyamine ABC transporter ATP-binding protein [Alistipes sp.]